MKRHGLRSAGLVLVLALLASGTLAQDSNTNTARLIEKLQQRIEELERKVQSLEQPKPNVAPTNDSAGQRIEALDQKVRVLERNRELAEESAELKAKEAPKISIGANGFSLGNADGSFAIQVKGVLQMDSRTFFSDSGTIGNDGFLLRRARPILQGTVFRDFDFLFVPDFGGTGSPQIFDAYLNYKYGPELQLRGGKFKSPVGLEQLRADQDLDFNERGLPTALVPNRDLGAMLHGDLFGGVASYGVGIFNGIGDARNSTGADFDDNKAVEGRLFFQPFKSTDIASLQGLGFGVGGSYEKMQGRNAAGLPSTTGGVLPGYTTDGQQQFFAYNPTNGVVVTDGEHWRLSPQGYYYYGPFSLLGEYVISNQKVARTGAAPLSSARLEHTAWQVAAGWVLTGEDANYRGGVAPRHPFDPRQGHWGAWQLVGRYSELHLDDDTFPFFSDPLTSAHSAKSWSVGLNWWLNRNIRVLTSYSHTIFDGGGGGAPTLLGAPAGVTRTDEDVFFTRLQLAF